MKTKLKDFLKEQQGSYPNNDTIPEQSIISKWRESDKSITDGDYDLLPKWLWLEVEEILKLEQDWKITSEKEELEIILSQKVYNLTNRLVKWRDTNYKSLSYDEDEGESAEKNEPIYDAVAYFIMSMDREWKRIGFETDDRVKQLKNRRKENFDNMLKKMKKMKK